MPNLICNIFPPGARLLSDGAFILHGRWKNLWRRWLSWRELDAGFDAFCFFLEKSIIGRTDLDQVVLVELNQYLSKLKNRFFLFLIWANSCGNEIRSSEELVSLRGLLDDAYWGDFNRWHLMYSNDARAISICKSWSASPVARKLTTVVGVDIGRSVDYYLFPRILSKIASIEK